MIKKMCFIVLGLSLFCASFGFFQPANASESISYYAKVEESGVYFYSNPIDEEKNKLFILPQTYFVYLTDEENENFYVAQYKDVYGYVRKQDVVVMNGTPTMPFASRNFTIKDLDGLSLYPSPSFSNNTSLAKIDYLTIVSSYYGDMPGENIPDLNSPWFYCKVVQDDATLFGYVYSDSCYRISTISPNTETFEIVSSPSFDVSQGQEASLSEVAMAFIVIGVSLPCILIIYLLIKPSLQKSKASPSKKKVRKRHGDYFEFDENDLN